MYVTLSGLVGQEKIFKDINCGSRANIKRSIIPLLWRELKRHTLGQWNKATQLIFCLVRDLNQMKQEEIFPLSSASDLFVMSAQKLAAVELGFNVDSCAVMAQHFQAHESS